MGLPDEIMESFGADGAKFTSEVETIMGLHGLYDVWANIRAWRVLKIPKGNVIKLCEEQLKILTTIAKEVKEEFPDWDAIIARERKAIMAVHEDILNE